MSEHSKCTTIYLSRELRQAKDKGQSTTGGQETNVPETKALSSLRFGKQQSHHWSLGIRRSFASTDLLHNLHPQLTHSAVSLDSLDGALPLHSDSSGEQHRVELQPTRDTQLDPKSSHSSRVSVDEISLPAGGEGKSIEGKKSEETEYEERWDDARDGTSETRPEDEGSGSLLSFDEEEEGEVVAAPKKLKGKQRHHVEAKTSIESPSKYLQEFHSLPKRLVPSEITHCLYELEEECRGVERESESVKWKMELIHRSVQTVQETLRTLLTRLVEAQSSGAFDPKTVASNHRPSTSHSCPPHAPSHLPHAPSHPPHAPSHSLPHSNTPVASAPAPTKVLSTHSHASEMSQSLSNPSQCNHQHCLAHCAVARRPSETCLTEMGPCCQKVPKPCNTDLPSCAQWRKERVAAFHAISDLRTGLKSLQLAQEEEHQEHRETLGVLRDFQTNMGTLVSHWQRDREDKDQSTVTNQLECLKQQASDITELARHAVTVFSRVGLQLEGLGAVGTLVRSASTKLIPPILPYDWAINSSLRCQLCNSKVEKNSNDGETEEE